MFFDGDDYVVLVFFEEEFYSKVFYTEIKSVIASFVVLEAWVLCEFVEKLFKGDDAGWFEAVHDKSVFEVYVGVGFNITDIFLHDFLGYYSVVDAEVLAVGHRGA